MKPILQPVSFQTLIERVYKQAEDVVTSTNTTVEKSQFVIIGLHKDGVPGPQPFQTPIDFLAFDLWHYDGRTSKHGAFMGGADFVQWHGNYELLKKQTQLEALAGELRAKHGHSK